MGTGTGAGKETRAVAERGTGTRMGTGTRIGSGRAEERRRSARYRTKVVDAVWETGETWVEIEKKSRKQRVGPVAANPENLENKKETGGGSTRHPGL